MRSDWRRKKGNTQRPGRTALSSPRLIPRSQPLANKGINEWGGASHVTSSPQWANGERAEDTVRALPSDRGGGVSGGLHLSKIGAAFSSTQPLKGTSLRGTFFHLPSRSPTPGSAPPLRGKYISSKSRPFFPSGLDVLASCPGVVLKSCAEPLPSTQARSRPLCWWFGRSHLR